MTAPCRVLVRHWQLDVSDDRLEALRAVLAPDERERAARLRVPAVARSVVVSRAMTRLLLARDCGCDPRDIAFELGANGKPSLTAPRQANVFNVSHSSGVCALATLPDGAGGRAADVILGIDIEAVRPIERDIAGAYFTPREAAWLDGLEADAREQAFIRLWVLKEAYLKATGEGLQGGLDRLEVVVDSLASVGPAEAASVGGSTAAASGWRLSTFSLAPRLLGGVALHGHAGPLRVEVIPVTPP